MARYWVAGATGFLGSSLVAHLIAKGHAVVAVSSTGGSVAGMTAGRCDVLDEAAVRASAEGCDGAFLAFGKVSRDPRAAEELYRLHVSGTRAVLRGLRQAGVSRVVYASTSGTIAVGEDPERIFKETDVAPTALIGRWPYYRSKLYAEREALALAEAGTFDVVIVNPSLLLGPGDLRESSTADLRKFLERDIFAVPSGGIAFVDVRDVAAAMHTAIELGRSGERYLLNAKNMTIEAYFQRLSRLSGVGVPALRMPRGRTLAVGAYRALERAMSWVGREPSVDEVSVEMAQCYWYCDSSKAERELGFKPREPGETLRETIADLVARGVAFPKRQSELEPAPLNARP